MKIESLRLTGFRAFPHEVYLDLDADTVIVAGANGQGKTSLFDGLLWALGGTIPRFPQGSSVVSKFSPSGQCRAAVALSGTGSDRYEVIRTSDGEVDTLGVQVGDTLLRGPKAETALLELAWPQALTAKDPASAFCAALERGIYLQQDLVDQFISADDDESRFATVSELVGAGRTRDLQSTLERSRRAWSRATNQQADEAQLLAERLRALRDRLAQLDAHQTDVGVATEQWERWWQRVADVVAASIHPPIPLEPRPPVQSTDAAGAMEATLSRLRSLHAFERGHLDMGRALSEDIASLGLRPTDDLAALRAAIAHTERQLEEAEAALKVAQSQAAAIRRQQVQLKHQSEQLRVFAQLALEHLGERCPVCEQIYDTEATRRRLQALALGDRVEGETQEPDVSTAALLVERAEGEAQMAKLALREARHRQEDWERRRARIASALQDIGIPADDPVDWPEALVEFTAEHERRVALLAEVREEGEHLALNVARLGEAARRTELGKEVSEVKEAHALAEADVEARRRTGELVNTMVDGLRDAGAEVVERQLRRLEPLLQRIYATADPHPAFRAVRLLSRMSGGRGRVMPEIHDPVGGEKSQAPETVLSSSQVNVLAVSIFLALNLGTRSLPLEVAILDDPLQSLDDLNLLGLVDLMRRVRERRQLLISTHDDRFARLLERKLRPVTDRQRTILIDLEGWTRDGPTIRNRDVPGEPSPLRIAA